MRLTFLILMTLGLILAGFQFAKAKDFVYFGAIDYPLMEDYSITPEDNTDLTLKILAGSTKEKLILKALMIADQNSIANFFTLPIGRTPATDLYFIKFTPENEDNFLESPELKIKYESDNKYKEAYFYDWTILEFVKLESVRDEINKTLTVKLPKRKKIMIALFNEPEIIGKASWYVYPKYSGQLIAASRDFAIDSKVKVYNFYNDREVIVTIKDFGPKKCSDWTEKEQRLMGPCQDRVLDLSKEAFLKLATTTGVGIISQVRVTPVDN